MREHVELQCNATQITQSLAAECAIDDFHGGEYLRTDYITTVPSVLFLLSFLKIYLQLGKGREKSNCNNYSNKNNQNQNQNNKINNLFKCLSTL